MCRFDYHKGTIVEAAKNLLAFTERYGSLRLIADANNACDFDEFMKGLGWLASQEQPCKGYRFGGGWSWWGDCPVRDCYIQKGVDFCYQCEDFPCKKLREDPLLKRKKEMIEVNNQIKNWELKVTCKHQPPKRREGKLSGLRVVKRSCTHKAINILCVRFNIVQRSNRA